MNLQMQQSSAFQGGIANVPPAENLIFSSQFQQSRVVVNHTRSTWVAELESRFNELTALPVGWDGYAGRPVAFNCAVFAVNMLERLCVPNVPPPSIVPGDDGTLQIEWHRNQYDVEIDILAPYNVIASRFDHRTGLDEELELEGDFTPVADWISALVTDDEGAVVEEALPG